MKEQFEAAVNRVAAKISEIENYEDFSEAVQEFINKGIDLQNEAWEAEYAIRKYEFSTAVLRLLETPEETYSALTAAHQQALDEINSNKRFKPEKPAKEKKPKRNHGVITINISLEDLIKAIKEGINA